MYTEIINYLDICIQNSQNFTIRVDNIGNLYKPTTGYIVSITPVINIGMSTFNKVKYIIETNNIKINNNNYQLYLGGWFENNTQSISTDISVVTDNQIDAIQIGKYCNQIAIYDIKQNSNILL